jgi:hypothetical protein
MCSSTLIAEVRRRLSRLSSIRSRRARRGCGESERARADFIRAPLMEDLATRVRFACTPLIHTRLDAHAAVRWKPHS